MFPVLQHGRQKKVLSKTKHFRFDSPYEKSISIRLARLVLKECWLRKRMVLYWDSLCGFFSGICNGRQRLWVPVALSPPLSVLKCGSSKLPALQLPSSLFLPFAFLAHLCLILHMPSYVKIPTTGFAVRS